MKARIQIVTSARKDNERLEIFLTARLSQQNQAVKDGTASMIHERQDNPLRVSHMLYS